MKKSYPTAPSITHQHIASILNLKLAKLSKNEKPVRILDFGCGEGKFISYLIKLLPISHPDICFEIIGLDVEAWKLLEKKGKPFLTIQHPDVDWDSRLSIITVNEKWPYPNNFFDFITSNQVMEHVRDYGFVFNEIHRCLRTDGLSINLFPVCEVLWEAHARMPIVHQINDVEKRARYMLFFARIGFKRCYKLQKRWRNWRSLDEFTKNFSRILEENTNYIHLDELTRIAERSNMQIGFTYTKDFFLAKIFSYLGKYYCKYKDYGVFESVALFFGKRLSSITVLLSK